MNKWFLSLFSTLLVVCAILIGGYWQAAYVAKPNPNATPVAFVVNSGETVKGVAEQLQQLGVINNAWAFQIFAKLNNVATQIQAGNFQLQPGMSFEAITAALGNAVGQDVQVTIPEGQTAAQIGALVRAVIPTITSDQWTAATGSNSSVVQTQTAPASVSTGLTANGMEGFLFPDTYRLDPSSNATDVAGKLYAEFFQKMSDAGIKENANGMISNNLSLYQVVTLASIVQMEAKNSSDMPDVADVFIKRLAAGIPLQSDATVSYAVGHAELTTTDLASSSPYNTFTHVGLTPGPIDNPGLAAIQAVISPSTNSWYYFLTTSDGSVKYARTYDEFLQLKAEYIK